MNQNQITQYLERTGWKLEGGWWVKGITGLRAFSEPLKLLVALSVIEHRGADKIQAAIEKEVVTLQEKEPEAKPKMPHIPFPPYMGPPVLTPEGPKRLLYWTPDQILERLNAGQPVVLTKRAFNSLGEKLPMCATIEEISNGLTRISPTVDLNSPMPMQMPLPITPDVPSTPPKPPKDRKGKK